MGLGGCSAREGQPQFALRHPARIVIAHGLLVVTPTRPVHRALASVSQVYA
jgi:hypothetical protein